MQELLTTEETYLQNLIVIDKVSQMGCEEFGITEDERMTIFSNVGVLLKCHTKFCHGLRDVVRAWDDRGTCVGVLFQEATWIKFYKYYVNDYGASQKLVQQLRRTNKRFTEFLKRYEYTDAMLGQNIESLLVVPVQRIPRYVLLLQDLAKHTPAGHSDSSGVQAALGLVRELADYINRSRRECENRAKLEEIDEALSERAGLPSLITATRRFLREGSDVLVGRDKRHVWLFNDMLLYAQPGRRRGTFRYRGFVALHGAAFERIGTSGFCVNDLVVTLPAGEDTEAWCSALTGALAESNDVLFGQLVTDKNDVSRDYLAIEDERRRAALTALVARFAEDEAAYRTALDTDVRTYFAPIAKAPSTPSRMLDRQTADAIAQPFLALVAAQAAFAEALAETPGADALPGIVAKHYAYFEEIARYAEGVPMRAAVLGQALAGPVFQLWVMDTEAKTKTSLLDIMDGPAKRLEHYREKLREILQASKGVVDDFDTFHANLNKLAKLCDVASKVRAAASATISGSKKKK